MKVRDFVNAVTSIKEEKELVKYIEKHIVNKYMPYEQKVSVCNNLIKDTSFIETNGVRLFKLDSPKRYMHYIIAMITYYTDVHINPENLLEDFNLLEQNGCTDMILACIPEKEVATIQQIIDMTLDDMMENERSIGRLYDVIDNIVNTVGSLSKDVEFASLVKQIGNLHE